MAPGIGPVDGWFLLVMVVAIVWAAIVCWRIRWEQQENRLLRDRCYDAN